MLQRFFSAAFLLLISTAANATDLLALPNTASPPEIWTGLHIGIAAGYGLNEGDPTYSFTNVPPQIVPLLPAAANLDADGGLIGGSAGYDKQFEHLVLGVEGDIAWTDFGEDVTRNLPFNPKFFIPPLDFRTNYQMDWLSTFRGRLGFASGRWLVYGTGGVAFAKVSLDQSVEVSAPANGRLAGSDEATKSGWTAGGGAAISLTNHVSLRAEALFYDLGHIVVHASDPNDPEHSVLTTDQDVNGTILKGGIDYRF